MQKWIGHVAMMSNKISNLIVFEIFATEHEYLRFCVYRVLMRFTVKITEISSAGFAPDGPHLFPSGNTKYPQSTTPLVVVSRSKPPSTTP